VVATRQAYLNERQFQAHPTRGPRSRGGLIFLPWVAAVAVLAALVLYSAFAPASTKRVSAAERVAAARVGGLAWGDTILWNKGEVRRWLRWHGGSYHTAFQFRHPAAVSIILRAHGHRAHSRPRKRGHLPAKPRRGH
jgi:hypothetical protein